MRQEKKRVGVYAREGLGGLKAAFLGISLTYIGSKY